MIINSEDEHRKLDKHNILDEDSVLYFFIYDVPHYCEHFDQIVKDSWESRDEFYLSKEISKYIHHEMHTKSINVNSFHEIETLLLENDQIVIYLGKNNYHFGLIRHLAVNNKEITFYHSFESSLKMKIFRMYTKFKISKKTDLLAVIRADRILDGHVEIQKLYYTKDIFSKHFTKQFLDYELYPKLRGTEYIDHNITKLFNDVHSTMLIMVSGSNPEEKHIKEFKDAVAKLPRKMIYVIADHEQEYFKNYEEIF